MLYLYDMRRRQRGIAALDGIGHFVCQVHKCLCAKSVTGSHGCAVIVVLTHGCHQRNLRQ